MNEGWENSTMISFGASRKMKMNSFVSWYKRVHIKFTNEVTKSYI